MVDSMATKRAMLNRMNEASLEDFEPRAPVPSLISTPVRPLRECLAAIDLQGKEMLLDTAEVYFPDSVYRKEGCRPVSGDAARALYLYLCEMDPPEKSLYYQVNALLRDRDRSKLTPYMSCTKLLLSALSALQRPVQQNLWRGVNKDLHDRYAGKVGQTIVFWGFTSTSVDMTALKKFLPDQGTLFCIRAQRACDISGFSAFKGEAEMLIPAGTAFKVLNVYKVEGTTMVELCQEKNLLGVPSPVADISNLSKVDSTAMAAVHSLRPAFVLPRAVLKDHTFWVNSVSFSPDGASLASASGDKTIILWNAATRTVTQRAQLKDHSGGLLSVAFSPDGALLASSSADTTIILWDLKSCAPRAKLEANLYSALISKIAFCPNSTTLASGGSPNSTWVSKESKDTKNWSAIMLWDIRTASPHFRLRGHTDLVHSVAFSPDGASLASASRDKTVMLWDIRAATPLKTLKGHNDTVFDVAFSPDGSSLASASEDKTIILWNTSTASQQATLQGHTSWVMSVAFSPDGTSVASGSGDKTIILWNASSGTKQDTWTDHTGEIQSVAFRPDGAALRRPGTSQ